MVFIFWADLMQAEGTEAANSYDYVLFVNLVHQRSSSIVRKHSFEQVPAPSRWIIQKKLVISQVHDRQRGGIAMTKPVISI